MSIGFPAAPPADHRLSYGPVEFHFGDLRLPQKKGPRRSSYRALHKKSWAVIDRPYSLGCATVGALYERPRCIFCAKPSYKRVRAGAADCVVARHSTGALTYNGRYEG